MTDDALTRCGNCALIGPTNAGKSTLLNRIIGRKVSIVSRKVQTTRCRVTGIYTKGSDQIVFVDTPGLFDARRPLDHAMLREVWATLEDVDVVVLVIDAAARDTADRTALEAIFKRKRPDQPIFLALNKCDAVHPKEKLLTLAQAYHDLYPFNGTFMIAGEKGDGVDDLVRAIASHLPKGPFWYEADQIQDMPDRMLAAEITREHIFDRLHEELPYHIMVNTIGFEQDPDGALTIHQDILTSRDQHKGMVIGKGGVTLKQIGSRSRTEMENIFGTRVHLYLQVRTEKDWETKESLLRLSGLLRF